MSNDETYNGWANREAWALALHLNNDEGLQEAAQQVAAGAIGDEPVGSGYVAELAGAAIVEWVQDIKDEYFQGVDIPDWYWNLLSDVGSFWRIDLQELGSAFLVENPYLGDGEGQCPACGEYISYCRGHGEIGDPEGFRILGLHDSGNHTECVVCDERIAWMKG